MDGVEDGVEAYSPMSVGSLETVEDDVKEVMNLCSADQELSRAVPVTTAEILSLIASLGGRAKGYRRERNSQISKMVA